MRITSCKRPHSETIEGGAYKSFKNSLVIYKEKTKEMNV